jgi:hypothetical protein
MAADLGWALPGGARWTIWAVWLMAWGVVLARGILRRRPTDLELAAALERSYPELGERLTGAVGLLGDARAHGSPALIAALADDAALRVGVIDALPPRALPARGPWRRLALGVAAAALVAAPGVLRPDPFGRLARRFLMPWAVVDRVALVAVTVAPGDAVAAAGDDLAVTARVVPRFRSGFGFGRSPARSVAWLEWTEAATGLTRRLAMTPATAPAPGRAFSVVLPRLNGSMNYRVISGAGESRWYRVRAVEPPAVAAVTARVEPPGYTGRPPSIARDPARVEAWEGSRVTLTVTTTAPVRSAEVAWPGPAEEAGARRVAARVALDGRSATAVLSADASGGYAITLRDALGLSSRPGPPRRVVVLADEPPVVVVRGADGLDSARADDTLRVGLAARDDVAVASAELHYSVDRAGATTGPGPDTGHVAAALEGLGTPSARGEAALGLSPLGLKPGDVVTYRARVTDNRPAPRGPNVAWSPPRRLAIVARAEPLWARRDRAGREAIQAQLDALKKAAAENRHETELLRYAADAARRGNGGWDRDRRQALDRRVAEARSAADRLDALALDLADEPAFRPLARPARQAAEVEAEAARATLDQARQADDPAERFDALRLADSRLAALSARLDDLQRGFDALARREADRRRVQDLADRQSRVADKADAQADPHPDLDRLAAEQDAVKNDLDSFLKSPTPPGPRADPAEADAEAKHRPDPKALADAREAMSQAARQLGRARDRDPARGRDALDAARRSMRGAAERLQAVAEAKGQGQPGDEPGGDDRPIAQSAPAPAPGGRDPRGGPAGVADPDPLAELQDLVRARTGRRWGELPGHLRTEILQMSQGRYRDDYARLIQLYFREIAGAGAEAKP